MVLLMAVILTSTAALAGPDFSVSNAVGLPGDTVVINVDYIGDGTIVTMQLDVLYNPAVLTPAAAVSGSAAPHGLVSNVAGPGKLRLLVPVVLQTPLPDIFTSRPLATIPFVIDPNATRGLEALSISNVVLGDASGKAVAAENLSGGEITILQASLLRDVPTLSFWGLALLIVVFTWFGVLAMRHKTDNA